VLDMHMPEMDGVALAQAHARTRPDLPRVLWSSLGRREVGDDEALFRRVPRASRSASRTPRHPGEPARARDGAQDARASQGGARPELAHRHPLRILLAEDNVVNQKLALRLLQQMGIPRRPRVRTGSRRSNRSSARPTT
jgi:CheY-like chemotaxis protein